MAESLEVKISAKTDEFVKSVEEAKTKVKSLSTQMGEIDKQMKLDSTDKVAKLTEKMELAQRAAEMAAKEAEIYSQKIKDLTDAHEDGSEMTDKERAVLAKLSEKMEEATQKSETYEAQVKALGKEIEDTGDDAEKSSSKFSVFWDNLKANLASDAIKSGLSAIGDAFQAIGEKAIQAAKDCKQYFDESVDLAAGYEDALGYSEQVFTSEADAVQKWVESNSGALRIGQADLLDYVNRVGALFTTFGFSAKESAANAEALVDVAVDLRAATGDDLEQVFTSLTGAMTGSYETLKRYGVVVNSTRVEAKAYAMGLVEVETDELAVKEAALKLTEATQKSAEALSQYGEGSVEYEKALINVEKAEQAYAEATEGKASEITEVAKQTALLAIVQEDLAYADGQAEKESDSYSSQLALRDTLLQNLKLTIGEKLLPVYTEFQKKVNEFIQSDAGKGVIDAVTEAIGSMAEKVLDFIQSEEFTSWVEGLEEEIPKLTEKIEDWAEKFGELFDKAVEWIESGGLEDLIEDIKGMAEAVEAVLSPLVKLIDAFGTLSDMDELDAAVKKSKEEVHSFADSLGIDYESMIGHITNFAEENHLKTADVLNDWKTYEPQVESYIKALENQVRDSAEEMGTDYDTLMGHIQKFADDHGLKVNQVLGDWQTYEPQIASYIQSLDQETQTMSSNVQSNMGSASSAFTNAVNDMANANTSGVAAVASEVEGSASRIQTACYNIGNWLSGIDWLNAPGSETEARASGGSVSAGQAYLVGEQGREIFVPQTNGYILNSGQTERVLNQSTDNSRSIGAVNVYLTSYGASAEEISDEIGAAISQKLRLSGAW